MPPAPQPSAPRPPSRGMLLAISLVCMALAGASSRVGAQYPGDDDGPASGMSQGMRTAVRAFDEGRDGEAMDRFMDILSRGSSAERAAANEYLNRLTQRMGEDGAPPRRAARAAPEEDAGADGEAPPPGAPEDEEAPRPRRTTSRQPAGADRAAMKREIDAKLKVAARRHLAALEEMGGVRVVMADAERPKAIAVPTRLLFDGGVAFRKEAQPLLSALAGLAYSLGTTQIAVLPEGAAGGDAKILDMRRTMGVSAHLFSEGISPARVRVNVLPTQVDIPKGLGDYRGLLLLFVYDRPASLRAEFEGAEEGGPPLSLGVHPSQLRPDKGEGVVIEFSVLEPAAGVRSWTFRLLQPRQGGEEDAEDGGQEGQAPLQEVSGSASALHQIYWNGRRNYFGEPLPAGRYEAVLSATDGRGRTRTLRRSIVLHDRGSGLTSPDGLAASLPPLSDLPDKILPARKARPAPRPTKKPSAKKAAAPRKRSKTRKPAAAKARKKVKAAVAARSAPRRAPSPAGAAVNYKIPFNAATQGMTQDGERRLAQVAETVKYYPLESLRLVGYAAGSEPEAGALALARAKTVSSVLVNKYGVDPRRVQLQSRIVDSAQPEVEIYIVSGK